MFTLYKATMNSAECSTLYDHYRAYCKHARSLTEESRGHEMSHSSAGIGDIVAARRRRFVGHALRLLTSRPVRRAEVEEEAYQSGHARHNRSVELNLQIMRVIGTQDDIRSVAGRHPLQGSAGGAGATPLGDEKKFLGILC